jgi:hypothetical protein
MLQPFARPCDHDGRLPYIDEEIAFTRAIPSSPLAEALDLSPERLEQNPQEAGTPDG